MYDLYQRLSRSDNSFASAVEDFAQAFESFVDKTVYENKDDNVIIYLEVPGYSKNEISLVYEDSILTVSAFNEKRGNLTKKYRIKTPVEIHKIKASSENGLLTITLPRKKDGNGLKIPVT